MECPLGQAVWSWLRSAIRLECFCIEGQSVNPEKLYAGLSLCGWFSSRCSLSISISLNDTPIEKNVWFIFNKVIYQKNSPRHSDGNHRLTTRCCRSTLVRESQAKRSLISQAACSNGYAPLQFSNDWFWEEPVSRTSLLPFRVLVRWVLYGSFYPKGFPILSQHLLLRIATLQKKSNHHLTTEH